MGHRESVFFYGSLKNAKTQEEVVGHRLEASLDVLKGYLIEHMDVAGEQYPVLQQEEGSSVSGMLVAVSSDELKLIDRYETDAYERIRVMLQSGVEAWTYVAGPKRTTIAGGVVLNTVGEVLLVNQNNNSWSLPKGHLDPGEDALSAARREIAEESGITELTLVDDLGEYERHKIGAGREDDTSELKRIHMYLFRTMQTELHPTDPHNPEARWIQQGEVARLLTHPKDREFFESVRVKLTA